MEGKSESGRRMSGRQTEAGKPQQAQGTSGSSFWLELSGCSWTGQTSHWKGRLRLTRQHFPKCILQNTPSLDAPR